MDIFRVERYGTTRFFAVYDAADALVCLCVYKRGALEVARRLQALDEAQRWVDVHGPAPAVPGQPSGVPGVFGAIPCAAGRRCRLEPQVLQPPERSCWPWPSG